MQQGHRLPWPRIHHAQEKRAATLLNRDNTMNQIVLQVDGMKCGGCAARLSKALESVEGVASATVDLPQRQITLHFDHRTNESALREQVMQAGFVLAH